MVDDRRVGHTQRLRVTAKEIQVLLAVANAASMNHDTRERRRTVQSTMTRAVQLESNGHDVLQHAMMWAVRVSWRCWVIHWGTKLRTPCEKAPEVELLREGCCVDDDGGVLEAAVVREGTLRQAEYMDKLEVGPETDRAGDARWRYRDECGSVHAGATRAPLAEGDVGARWSRIDEALTVTMTLWHDITTTVSDAMLAASRVKDKTHRGVDEARLGAGVEGCCLDILLGTIAWTSTGGVR